VIPIEEIPEALRKHVAAETPAPMRMLAARGVAPLPPKDLIIVQCVLAAGDEPEIAAAAVAGLAKHPEAILAPIVGGDLPGFVLRRLGEIVVDKPALLERVLLNRALPDASLAELMPILPESALPLAFQNEERLLRSAPLVLALRAHPQASPAQIDRMVDFLVRAGVIVEGVPEFTAALMRLSPSEALQAMKDVAVPEDLIDKGTEAPVALEPEPVAEASAEDVPDIAAELIPAEEAPKANQSLLGRLQSMTIAQKIAVGLKGNKEVRSTLVRDSNKLVALAALKNPRLTEQEVGQIANSRNVHEEVIRLISMNGEWLRVYAVKLALVGNPKTPLPVAMKFLPLLKAHDIKNIAKSKNLPSAVANQAKILLQKQRG
jgi:hypothetical protein